MQETHIVLFPDFVSICIFLKSDKNVVFHAFFAGSGDVEICFLSCFNLQLLSVHLNDIHYKNVQNRSIALKKYSHNQISHHY